MKIKEIIVVEGKNDTLHLKQFLDCDTIETHGTCLSDFTLNLIKKANKERGVIIFTDPDAPGEKIRSQINEKVKGCKNAFIDKTLARTEVKVGVEHANKEDILTSLENLVTYSSDYEEKISMEDFLALGLSGQKNSKELRDKVGRVFSVGTCNAKTLRKRLNMLQIEKKELEKVLLHE